MHYSNLVIIENNNDIETQVNYAMKDGKEVWWDFFQIGGRFTGIFDNYDPYSDPKNQEKCYLCNGTGIRNDSVGEQSRKNNPEYKCNGCDGKGIRTKWPTQFGIRKQDVMPIGNLTNAILNKFFRVVSPHGVTYGGEDYYPWRETNCFVDKEKPTIDWLQKTYPNHFVVIVDNHD